VHVCASLPSIVSPAQHREDVELNMSVPIGTSTGGADLNKTLGPDLYPTGCHVRRDALLVTIWTRDFEHPLSAWPWSCPCNIPPSPNTLISLPVLVHVLLSRPTRPCATFLPMASALNKRQQARNERTLQELLKVEGNSTCADCGARNPGWASYSVSV
jgi:hypothetical protein